VKRFPESANVYDSLGEGYEKNEQFELAEENYAKAFATVKDGDPAREMFQINLKRMQEKLEK